MSSPTKFLQIYRDLAKSQATTDDLSMLYWDLKYKVDKTVIPSLLNLFSKSNPSEMEMASACDSVAQEIHKSGDAVLQKIYPGADVSLFQANFNELNKTYTTSCNIGKSDKEGIIPFVATCGMVFLEKSKAGMVSKNDIWDGIEEYERLYTAHVASPAEILTLYRYYGPGNIYERYVLDNNLNDETTGPIIVGGPASVAMVDKEGHLITVDALDKAFKKFMSNFRNRNSMIYHSDVQVGWVLPCFIAKNGQVFKSGIYNNGLWAITELRNDTNVSKKVIEEIKKGNIKK